MGSEPCGHAPDPAHNALPVHHADRLRCYCLTVPQGTPARAVIVTTGECLFQHSPFPLFRKF